MANLTREQLIELLGAVQTEGAYYPEADDQDVAYFDWSTIKPGQPGQLEVYDGDAVAQVPLSWEQLRDLHARLSLTLLRHEG